MVQWGYIKERHTEGKKRDRNEWKGKRQEMETQNEKVYKTTKSLWRILEWEVKNVAVPHAKDLWC